jgi:hypothetical protein
MDENNKAEEEKEKQPKKWLINHDLASYRRLHDEDTKSKIIRDYINENDDPLDSNFASIAYKDLIVYYSNCEKVLVGIFKVSSDKKIVRRDKKRNYVCYQISPIKPVRYIDMTLIPSKMGEFKSFPDGLLKEEFEEHNHPVCRMIEEGDFKKFNEIYDNEEFMKRYREETNIAILSSLLGFYGSKAASFINLFLATLFGIVTLSAIIQFIDELEPTIISLALFIFFSIIGIYTFEKYSYYGLNAEKIKRNFLEKPNFDGLNYVMFYDYASERFVGYSDYYHPIRNSEEEKIPLLKKAQTKISEGKWYFRIIYLSFLVGLAIVIYWNNNYFQQLLASLSNIKIA